MPDVLAAGFAWVLAAGGGAAPRWCARRIARCDLTQPTHSGKGGEAPLEILAIDYWYGVLSSSFLRRRSLADQALRGDKVGETHDTDT